MNKSLEALNRLIYEFSIRFELKNEYATFIYNLAKTIEQDLEAYEQLKDEYQKLKKDYDLLDTTMESDDRIICQLLNEKEQLENNIKLNEAQIDDLTLEVANYKHTLEEKNEIIMDLKEEMETLKKYDMELFATTFKLKKAIEILKDRFVINLYVDEFKRFRIDIDCNTAILTKEQHELLKEVLE